MTTARKQLVSLDATPYYHCISRCVRQNFLCGVDPISNVSYEHRKSWVEDKLLKLASIYCIDVCAYAIMSNHYHVVLHINKDKALELSPKEVVSRWSAEHKLPLLISRWLNGEIATDAEQNKCIEIIEVWRKRLWSLSWFMRELNYAIAYKANREDDCKGHFWEGRFKSQALLDEKALAAAMAYVDLNPVRAGIAKTPEDSPYTSIRRRLKSTEYEFSNTRLYPFARNKDLNSKDRLPFGLIDYLQLLDWTSRCVAVGKAHVPESRPALLVRLQFDDDRWLSCFTKISLVRTTAVGGSNQYVALKVALNKSKLNMLRLD